MDVELSDLFQKASELSVPGVTKNATMGKASAKKTSRAVSVLFLCSLTCKHVRVDLLVMRQAQNAGAIYEGKRRKS